ncbi:hypothetical protein WJX77_005364 [Trebouxia sp. C0004]
MSIANQSLPRDLPVLHKKLLLQPAVSPSRSKTVLATSVAETKTPLPKSKPKQRYLKRGTGLQTRLAAAKQKRYVPKGGFIKGQAENETVQQPHAPASSLSRDSDGLQQGGKHSMPAGWPQLTHPSSARAKEPSPPAHRQHDQAGMVHRHSQGNSQPYTYAADQEPEMDADTALVHFPGTAQQSRQAQGNGRQPFEPYISAHQHTAAPHVLKSGRSSQQQDRPHAEGSMHNDPLQAAYMQSSADNGAAPVDWQLQQAAEALELEEFRALERQITQDSGMSVRGSVASLSAVTGVHNPIAGLKADTHRLLQSEHRKPLAPMSQSSTQSLQQARDQHQMPWQYSASQAAESESSLHEAHQAYDFQAPRQLPSGRVTGNPFATPEDFDGPATSLLSDQQESIAQEWDAQGPSYARHSSRAQSVDQPQVDFYAEAQQAIPDSDFKHESAWDAAQVAQRPAHNSDEASQNVQSGLQSTKASQSYIQGLFRQQQPIKPACETKMEHPNDTQAASIAALEQEMKDMQSERAKVSKLRAQLEQASTRMEQEKAAWERQKAEEAASWESEKEADSQRLKRHQRVLDKQSRALLKLPNRKERSEVEAVEAILGQERKAGHAKDARHKLTVERLRQKLVELQDTNAELRDEIRFHEQRRLEEWNAKENQQPKPNSKCRAAGGALSGAATSTNRSKLALSPQEASSKPSQAAAQHAPAMQSSQPVFVQSNTASNDEAAQTSTASLADDISEADYVELGEAVTEQLAGPATANGMQWRVQRHGLSGPAYLASQQADQQPQRGLENSVQAAYGVSQEPQGTPGHKAQPLDAFQPIANMRPSDVASRGPSMAAQQQGSQADHVTKADRYQHATMLDSPDEFTWQPIRPPYDGNENGLEAPHSHLIPSAQADPWGQTHMASSQHGYRQGDSYSRSLRQSLDAAARLDARLQDAQQQQQQHADASHQQAGQQHQYTAAVKAGLGSSSSWQDLQEAYAAAQPQAQSQKSGLQHHHQQQHQQQQCYQEQHALMGVGGQAQKASRGSMYDGPILMDRSRPQTAADVPAATSAVGQALTQSAQAQGLPGSLASHTVAYYGDNDPSSQALNNDTGSAHDQEWAGAGSTTAAQEGITQSMQDNQQRSAGNEHLSSVSVAPEKPYQELSYPDGKVEQIFLDGRRTVVFGNGTCKHQFPDGHTAIRFTNKDIKRFYPCGRVEYYYCEVDTWHTTHANGIEVFYFPNGQTEAHHPSGTKEIIFPDGVIRRVFTDGREQDVTPEQLSSPVKYAMPQDRD